MAFPESVVEAAWRRSRGECECTRTSHTHGSWCPAVLKWELRGSELAGGWEAHHRVAGGPDTLDNCEILCQSCHKLTQWYG